MNTRLLLNEAIDLLKKLEWSSYARGQGSGFMGSGGDGVAYPACPVCKGIHPKGSREFTASAIGHRKNCQLVAIIERGE